MNSHRCPLLGPGCRRTFLPGSWKSSELNLAGGSGGDPARVEVVPVPNRNHLCSRNNVLVQTSLRRWFKWFAGRVMGMRDTAGMPGVGELTKGARVGVKLARRSCTRTDTAIERRAAVFYHVSNLQPSASTLLLEGTELGVGWLMKAGWARAPGHHTRMCVLLPFRRAPSPGMNI